MNLRYTAVTDTGRRRSGNEDSYSIVDELGLAIVADGMGGHAAGEVASALAVGTITKVIQERHKEITTLAEGGPKHRNRIRRILRDSVRKASQTINEEARKAPSLRGMGTTVSLLLLVEDRAFVAHVGDSRVYLARQGEVHQITTDHNLVTEMVRAGRLKAEEAEATPFNNALTRAVGVYANVEVDTLDLELLSDDRFLICSDGLHGYLHDDTIEEGLDQPLEEQAQWFVDFANEKGGKDNITAITLQLGEIGDPEAGARLRLTIETLHKIPLFQHLSYADLVQVINVSRAREVSAEEALIHEGDEGDALYIVLKGRVAVEKGGNVFAILGPGRHFGEMSLVDNQPRSATVRTTEKSVLIRIIRNDFYELLRQDSVLAVKLLWNFIQTLSGRLRAANPDNLFEEWADTYEEDSHPYGLTGRHRLNEALASTSPGVDIPEDLDDDDDD